MGYFIELSRRDPNDPFEDPRYGLAEDAPKWVRDAVYAAHQGDLPNDWIYGIARSFFEECTNPNDEEFSSDFAEKNVDVYTKRLAHWYADHCLGYCYAYAAEEASDLGLIVKNNDIGAYIGAIQWFAIRSIAETLMHAWRGTLSEDET